MKSYITSSVLMFSAIIIVFMHGCSPVYYPNAISNPLLKERGDLSVTVHGGLYGGDLQTAIAITDHFGVTFNGQYQLRNSFAYNSYIFNSQGVFGELGALGFFDFGTNGKFEIMAGYGKGVIEGPFSYNDFVDSKDVIQNRSYLQPTIGWQKENSSIAITYRFTLVEMRQYSLSRRRFFMEPTVTMKTGFENFKFVFQAGVPLYAIYSNSFGATPLILNIGMQFSVNTLKLHPEKDTKDPF